jgi:DNA-binding MarR family transcriptional regulator
MASCGMELTSEQCLILVMLGCESQVNQQDLADRMFKDKTGISRLVSGMERKGLIQRTSTIEDRRNNFVQLTDFGRSTLSTIQKQLSEIRVEAREGIAEKDMETCRRVLQKLVDNLSACEEQAG